MVCCNGVVVHISTKRIGGRGRRMRFGDAEEGSHMIFREATIDDAKRLAEIYLHSRKTELSYAPLAHSDDSVKEWIANSLIPSGGVTVAEENGGLKGFIAVSDDGTYGWIDHVYLEPAATGLGIGGKLIDRAKQTLRSPIRLYTFQQNEGARRFYQRHGFQEIVLSDGSLNQERIPDVLMEWRQRDENGKS